MDSAVTLPFRSNRHVKPPFVVAFIATQPDAYGSAFDRGGSHERHPRLFLTGWANHWEGLPILDGVWHTV